jgi:hypothetical protein
VELGALEVAFSCTVVVVQPKTPVAVAPTTGGVVLAVTIIVSVAVHVRLGEVACTDNTYVPGVVTIRDALVPMT